MKNKTFINFINVVVIFAAIFSIWVHHEREKHIVDRMNRLLQYTALNSFNIKMLNYEITPPGEAPGELATEKELNHEVVAD